MKYFCVVLVSILFVFVNTQKAPEIPITFIANVTVFGESNDGTGDKGVISQCNDKLMFFFNFTIPKNRHFPNGGYFAEIYLNGKHYIVVPGGDRGHKCVCYDDPYFAYFWWLPDAEKTPEPPPDKPILECWGVGEHVREDVCFLNSTIYREYKFLMLPQIHYIDYKLFVGGKCIEPVLPKECVGITC